MKLEGSPPSDTQLSGNHSQAADSALRDKDANAARAHHYSPPVPPSSTHSHSHTPRSLVAGGGVLPSSSSSSKVEDNRQTFRPSSSSSSSSKFSSSPRTANHYARHTSPPAASASAAVASVDEMTALRTPPLAPSVPREKSDFRLPPIHALQQDHTSVRRTHYQPRTNEERYFYDERTQPSSMYRRPAAAAATTTLSSSDESNWNARHHGGSRGWAQTREDEEKEFARHPHNNISSNNNSGGGGGGGGSTHGHRSISNAEERVDEVGTRRSEGNSNYVAVDGGRSDVRQLDERGHEQFRQYHYPTSSHGGGQQQSQAAHYHPSHQQYNTSAAVHSPTRHPSTVPPPPPPPSSSARSSSSRFSPPSSSLSSSMRVQQASAHSSVHYFGGSEGGLRSSASPSRRPLLPSLHTLSAKPSSTEASGGMHERGDDKAEFDGSGHIPSEPRATSFMASLLRAAQSPEPQSPSVPIPMSVHAIVEGRAASPNVEKRPRKRRTSSVQEPLQGSALEAATRAKGFPRHSDSFRQHHFHRQHADDLSSRYSTSSFPHTPPLPRGVSVGFPQSPIDTTSHSTSARFPHSSVQRWRAPEWSQLHHESASPPYAHSAYAASPPPYVYDNEGQQASHNAAHRSYQHAPQSSSFGPAPHHHHSSNAAAHSTGMSSPQSTHSMRQFAPRPEASFKHSNAHQGYTTSGVPSARSSYTGKHSTNSGGSSVIESVHWNNELANRARMEHEAWSRTSLNERRQQVTQSIWDARSQLCNALTYWPPPPSNVTTIRCMYANIAQKSYGSEKRFLCPPPVVKINGPLRPCKWVTMRVTLGDSSVMHGTMGSVGSGALGGAVAGGEEPAMLDAQGEARFGKLHVGSVSDATSKVFRLQVNLLRAETTSEEAKNGGGFRAFQDVGGPLQLPAHAWSTFHSSPINVISKPARKSVRTRAASPAIASGSIVCLYNRLNSQTVRTKYLGVETGAIEDVARTEVARKLVARQDGWEGFAIELLARPLHDPAVTRANSRGVASDEWGITYGSIVCLRDVNSKLCSDPMLICKVDKGRVELSSVIGNGAHGNDVVRFQIASKNREEARRILFGGARANRCSRSSSAPSSSRPAGVVDTYSTTAMPSGFGAANARREGSEESSTGSPRGASAATEAPISASAATSGGIDANSMLGGPVIQMQKVTLMHITPLPVVNSTDEIECDLATPRAYLCSTASENSRDEPSQPALARSLARMQSRSDAVHHGAQHVPLDEVDSPVVDASKTPRTTTTTSSSSPVIPLAEAAAQAQSASVGFSHPPAVVYDSSGSGGQVDVLEDQFCWTIVTTSCTEVSYIEANASADGRDVYPHLPTSTLPVTPFPCLAAQPSYDARSHSLAATVHDYLYADGLDPHRHLLNTVSAVHAAPNKLAHEVWLAHSGPLATHASSAGPYMSDVTVNLPNMDQLLALHVELHELSSMSRETVSRIRLPILFVRVAQGLTFPSGHWLVADRIVGARHDVRDALAWSFRIV